MYKAVASLPKCPLTLPDFFLNWGHCRTCRTCQYSRTADVISRLWKFRVLSLESHFLWYFQLIVSELIKFLDILCLLQICSDLVALTWKLIFNFISQRKSYVCNVFNGETVAVYFITAVLQIFCPLWVWQNVVLNHGLIKAKKEGFLIYFNKIAFGPFFCPSCAAVCRRDFIPAISKVRNF